MAEMHYSKIILISFIFVLFGCSDPVVEQIEKQLPITELRVKQLAQALDNGQVRNANLIKQYADKVVKLKPDFAPLVNEFRKEATTASPIYKSIVERLKTAKNSPELFADSNARYEEILNIYQAADPVLYSDALSDPLNVLADMSDGTLPRVNALSKSQSLAANNAQDFGVGEQLIGNPNYGNWTTGSNGMSFWQWYGMYAMMDNLLDRRRVSYSQWGRSRNYSYYHDYGRTRYSSPSQLQKQTQLETRTRKSFTSRGQKYNSTYSKNRTGSSSLSGQSKQAQTSAKRFSSSTASKSNYAKKSSSAKKSSYAQGGNFRNSKTTTSRSFRRGK
ncbi:hypothetical protein ACOYR1_13745 [Thalassotalea piscium]